jgi:transcriptional regulator with XRE-family HTH domain
LSARDIDAHVGRRLRERREALGISQGRLGRHLGLTFSQVQKYEKGSNRIGAGRLFQIADLLGVPTSHFFEGLAVNGAAGRGGAGPAASAASPEEVRQLTAAFGAISEASTRASVLALVRSLADEDRTRSGRRGG